LARGMLGVYIAQEHLVFVTSEIDLVGVQEVRWEGSGTL
jgi:hypothetical protein